MRSTAKNRPVPKVKGAGAPSHPAGRPPQEAVAAAKAKAGFLSLIERVSTERRPVTVTKRGKPMVQIIPIDSRITEDPFGCMKGSVKIVGDIVGPEPDVWEAMS